MKKFVGSLLAIIILQMGDLEPSDKVLEEALKKYPNNGRYVFFLAQAYQDTGELEKALAHYQKCAELHANSEEGIQALLQIAILKESLGLESEEVIQSYKRALEKQLSQGETLYYLSRYARNNHQHETSYEAASQGVALSYPQNTLFNKDWIYDYGLLFEYSVSAYRTQRYMEALLSSQLLQSNQTLPSNITTNVEKIKQAAHKKIAIKASAEATPEKIKDVYQLAQLKMDSNDFEKALEQARWGLMLSESLDQSNYLKDGLLAIYWLASIQMEHEAEALIASKLLLANHGLTPNLATLLRSKIEQNIGRASSDNSEEELAALDNTTSEIALFQDPSLMANEPIIYQNSGAAAIVNESDAIPAYNSVPQGISAYFMANKFNENPDVLINENPVVLNVDEEIGNPSLPIVPYLDQVEVDQFELQSTCCDSTDCDCCSLMTARVYGTYHFGNGIGHVGPYATVGEYVDMQIGCFQPFVDLRGHFFKDKEWAANAGVGLRYVDQEREFLLGLNTFYDFRHISHNFEQIGVGLELSMRQFDISANYYIPIGNKSYVGDVVTFNYPGGFFATRSEHFAALSGQDVEIGTSLSRWFCNRCFDVYVGGGVYHYRNRKGSSGSFTGGMYTAELSVYDMLFVGLRGTYDNKFKKTLQGYATLSIPFDQCGCLADYVRQKCFYNRFSGRPAQRNPIILESQPSCHWVTNFDTPNNGGA